MSKTYQLPGIFRVIEIKEAKISQKGNPYISMSVVQGSAIITGTEVQSEDNYASVIASNEMIPVVESLAKHDLVLLSGQVTAKESEYKGQKRVYITILANTISLLSRKPERIKEEEEEGFKF